MVTCLIKIWFLAVSCRTRLSSLASAPQLLPANLLVLQISDHCVLVVITLVIGQYSVVVLQCWDPFRYQRQTLCKYTALLYLNSYLTRLLSLLIPVRRSSESLDPPLKSLR